MTRGSEDYEDWNLENLLKALLKEIELRERTSQMFENRNSTGTSVGNHNLKGVQVSRVGRPQLVCC